MTNSKGSVFPIGFSDQVIVCGRPILPYYNKSGSLHGQTIPVNGSYTTSYPTPATASKAQLLFGLHADVKDANDLLEMMESATETDYISLNGMRQALPNYNPAKFYKKYCISVDIPSSIQEADIIPLTKGWYKGLLFAIPGSEVLVNDEWITFDAKNKDLILAQNPMNLEWRLNGTLLRKYGYTPGQTIQGQIITVDDQCNGLRLEVPISITIR